MKTKQKRIATPTIGEILKEEFLVPMGISAYKLAKELKVSNSSILDITNDKRKLTVEMALRFSKFFGNSEKFWLNIQNDIEIRNKKISMKKELNSIQSIIESA